MPVGPGRRRNRHELIKTDLVFIRGGRGGITLRVYPIADIPLDPFLPADAEFWVPGPEDIDEYEGFGLFQDVWTITDVPVAEAAAVASEDRELCRVVGDLARDAAGFDLIAMAVQAGSADEVEGISDATLAALGPYLTGRVALEGLEAGVAGLVYMLAAAGMFPAASCRGHPEPDAWSAFPVVFLAADRPHAEALQPLVACSGCGFTSDPLRPGFLVINGRSVQDTQRLAEALLRSIGTFGEPG